MFKLQWNEPSESTEREDPPVKSSCYVALPCFYNGADKTNQALQRKLCERVFMSVCVLLPPWALLHAWRGKMSGGIFSLVPFTSSVLYAHWTFKWLLCEDVFIKSLKIMTDVEREHLDVFFHQRLVIIIILITVSWVPKLGGPVSLWNMKDFPSLCFFYLVESVFAFF